MAYRRMVGMGNGTVTPAPVVAPLDYQSPNSCNYGLNGCGCSSCGMGIFDSGMDFTTWSWPEWSVVGIGVYALLSLVGDTKRGVQRTRRVGRAVRKAV